MKILFSDPDEKLYRPPNWITNSVKIYACVWKSPLKFVGDFIIFYFNFLLLIGAFISSVFPFNQVTCSPGKVFWIDKFFKGKDLILSPH